MESKYPTSFNWLILWDQLVAGRIGSPISLSHKISTSPPPAVTLSQLPRARGAGTRVRLKIRFRSPVMSSSSSVWSAFFGNYSIRARKNKLVGDAAIKSPSFWCSAPSSRRLYFFYLSFPVFEMVTFSNQLSNSLQFWSYLAYGIWKTLCLVSDWPQEGKESSG